MRTEALPALEVVEECYASGRDAGENILSSSRSHFSGAVIEKLEQFLLKV